MKSIAFGLACGLLVAANPAQAGTMLLSGIQGQIVFVDDDGQRDAGVAYDHFVNDVDFCLRLFDAETDDEILVSSPSYNPDTGNSCTDYSPCVSMDDTSPKAANNWTFAIPNLQADRIRVDLYSENCECRVADVSYSVELTGEDLDELIIECPDLIGTPRLLHDCSCTWHSCGLGTCEVLNHRPTCACEPGGVGERCCDFGTEPLDNGIFGDCMPIELIKVDDGGEMDSSNSYAPVAGCATGSFGVSGLGWLALLGLILLRRRSC